MEAAERLGWTLDDLHERVAACETLADRIADLEADDEDDWTAAVPLAFLRIVEELLSLGKDFRTPVPAALLRRIRRLDERLPDDQVTAAAGRIRSWLLQQEKHLPEPPVLTAAPLGADVPDNLVTLPQGAQPSDEKERLRGLRTERWVALPARAEVRKRVADLRSALGDLALVLSAANGSEDLPFGTLDRKRLAMVAQATRHTLGGPLIERGLLTSLKENAAILERRATAETARRTAKRARVALEVLLSDLG